jgi:hypothetical protein
MLTVAGIPSFVVSLVMIPAIRKFDRDFTAPMQALIKGATVYVQEPAPGCACSVM